MEVKNRSLELNLDVFSDNPFFLHNLKKGVRKIGKLAVGVAAVSVPTYLAINAAASYIVTRSLVNLLYEPGGLLRWN